MRKDGFVLPAERPRANGPVAALEYRIRPEREWLDLTTLRFFTHPALRHVFPEFLIGVYHAMHTAGAVMEAARSRCMALAPHCPVAARLVPYWAQHIREEAGHDNWLLSDLRRLGVELESALAAPPAPGIAELMGTLHFWVLHTHPVAALVYFYLIEARPPNVEMLDWIVRSAVIPRDALETFYRHARIDVAHGRELADLIDSLPLEPPHFELMVVSARTTVHQLGRILEPLIIQADQLPPNPATETGE